MAQIVPDHIHPGAFVVRTGVTEQSWVDLEDPLRLEFEYVQRIAEILEATVLARPAAERVRILHVGGGGLSLPRYVAARRPETAQVVLEPDAALVEEVRERLPLPRRHRIKIRPVDGRTGIADFAQASLDAVIVDAFQAAQVPGELASLEWFTRIGEVLRPDGILVMNLGDRAPFDWGRRCVAGIASVFDQVGVSAETPTWKGRRYGNLVAMAGRTPLPVSRLERDLARAGFPYRLVSSGGLRSWIGDAVAFTDADTCPSLDPVALGWLR